MNEKKYTVFFRPPPWTAPKSYQVETDTSKKAYNDAFCLLIDDVGFEEALAYGCNFIEEEKDDEKV